MAEDLRRDQEVYEEPANEAREGENPEFIRFKERLGAFFDEKKDVEEIIKVVMNWIKPFLDAKLLDGREINDALSNCVGIKDREKLIEEVSLAVKPFLDFKRDNPEAFEKIERQTYHETSGYTKLNEVLAWEVINESTIAIHLAPARYLGRLREQVVEGLQNLAKIVKEKEEKEGIKIKEIEAVSWIVGKNPELMEKFGFTVTGIITETSRMPGIPMSRAVISKEDLLDRYLIKEK